ncbi:hypothetical protein A3K73_03760 [Candidatus Pacearchaeota archaeon RBG_13_36_9]|nr:MAG: hypothetical protein A3K73_03760 [Candidatus Pacearchaeota archaeon RBG_13_36_9]
MWVAKFRIKHDCILGNRCEKFNITLQGTAHSVFKEKGKIVTLSMIYMSGDPKNLDNFVKDLSKDKQVVKVERRGSIFLLLEKANKKAVKFYTPKIIFIRPVIMDTRGYETWEIGSWERREVEDFINNVEKTMENFKLLKFKEIGIDNIYFPKLMPDLTGKQKEAIELAIQNGYYKSVRKTNLRKLAKLMNLSLSTYNQHLRAAEEKLIPNLLSYFS